MFICNITNNLPFLDINLRGAYGDVFEEFGASICG